MQGTQSGPPKPHEKIPGKGPQDIRPESGRDRPNRSHLPKNDDDCHGRSKGIPSWCANKGATKEPGPEGSPRNLAGLRTPSANDRSWLPDVVALQEMECGLLLRHFALHATMAEETRRQDF
jgi:hypothetical protein